jgi:hypothetical protein
MPVIRDEVLSGTHLRQYREERQLLVPFLSNFDVNSAYSRTAHNTRISAYILGPDIAVRQQFGLTEEILLVISDYPEVQPRTLQAVEQIMQEPPAAGRVDPTVFFLVTPDSNALIRMQNHGFLNSHARIPVVFDKQHILARASDTYLVRGAIADQLYSRDLFNDQLPLRNDLFFVGRDQIVAEFLSAIKQSQNRGLFGLRKTGKTSVLFKVRRLAQRDGLIALYYDCKDPAIRNLHWQGLLKRIIDDLAKFLPKAGVGAMATRHISDQFKHIVQHAMGRKCICIIFDEIEHVSPLAKADRHWHEEFVDFWQAMWTTQSEFRNISFLIAGVNPTIVEMDQVAEMQNPVFSIVPIEYMTGLTASDVGLLLNHIGQWMGLKFEQPAIEYIVRRYGGHPLLTRMACSHIHNLLTGRGARRPATITRNLLVVTEADREADITQYSRHVVSELSSFYPTEYQMLEMLAAGNIAEFIELSKGNDYTRHLQGYGLVDAAKSSKPVIKIPMISRYINQARATREKTIAGPQIINNHHRPLWLRDRVARIIADVRQMEKVARERGMPKLYGQNGFPEAERFGAITPCLSMAEFDHFINVCNRCFVEPVENMGMSAGKKDYFWKDVKASYPDFWHGLLRTKVYRNDQMHLFLKKQVEDQLRDMLDNDFLGLSPEQMDDPPFALQQMVIDGLFVGVQAELERIT